jgi:hypothetical protein
MVVRENQYCIFAIAIDRFSDQFANAIQESDILPLVEQTCTSAAKKLLPMFVSPADYHKKCTQLTKQLNPAYRILCDSGAWNVPKKRTISQSFSAKLSKLRPKQPQEQQQQPIVEDEFVE